MDWNKRGIPAAGRAALWRANALRKTLLSPSAAGLQRGYAMDVEPVLDRITWDRLHDLLEDPGRRRHASNAVKSPFSGADGLRQQGCGKPLLRQKRGDNRRVRLICLKQATGGCGKVTIGHDDLEDFVLRMVWEVIDTAGFRNSLQAQAGDADQDDVELRRQLGELDDKLYSAWESYEDGQVSKHQAAPEGTPGGGAGRRAAPPGERDAEPRVRELADAGGGEGALG